MPQAKSSPVPYDLHPSVAYVQTILANFKLKTGRSVEEWVQLVRAQNPLEPKAWLKDQGLGTNQAMLVIQRVEARPGFAFDDTPAGYLAAAPGYVETQYSGRKRALRPLFEALVTRVRSLGPEVKVCPCETLVPFYRNHVFAEAKAFATRLDLGLALGDPTTVLDPSGHLEDTGGFKKKDRITHKLELTTEADLQAALPWLQRAFERDQTRA